MKKSFTRVLSVIAAIACVVCMMAPAALAASTADAIIDTSRTGSITLFKIDHTSATGNGAWDDSYNSTGVEDQDGVNDVLADYPIEGVEFSYLKVAGIEAYTQTTAGVATVHTLYTFAADDALLGILGLTADDRFIDAEKPENTNGTTYYYESNTVIAALRTALATDPTGTKNAIEAYILTNRSDDAAVSGAMPLTDAAGKSTVANLELGLYLMVETLVPENVTNTTNPFFISLPMTSIDGTNATDGGHRWMYDVTVYPKNETGTVDLEKTVREALADTGNHTGSLTDITDGYAHVATGSAGDVVDYQIISTLPTITSTATNISVYTFVDTLAKGISYNKRSAEGTDGVKIEWFTDAACTNKVAEWSEDSGKFNVAYTAGADSSEVMTITMTDSGLAEINTAAGSAANINNAGNMTYAGYSNYTIRITYTGTIDSAADLTLGDSGNANTVTLTWKRTSETYSDTLTDDAHVYSYGIDLTKQFAEKTAEAAKTEGLFDSVRFTVQNTTDGYFVKAALNAAEGVYYVTDHVATEAEATLFVPVTDADGNHGKIVIKGLENDTYKVVETQTADKYVLNSSDIIVNIVTAETVDVCDVNYNEHKLLTAAAGSTVNSKAVTLNADGTSNNALVALNVVNYMGWDVPETGDNSMIMLTTLGSVMVVSACVLLFVVCKFGKKKEEI